MTHLSSSSYHTYRELEVTTAPPEKLTLMMYDGAINFLVRAREKLIAGDYAAKGEFIAKAISIINELLSSLNPEGGQITVSLRSLYVYFMRRLMEADFNKDVKGIEEIIGFMKDLREAWHRVCRGNIVG